MAAPPSFKDWVKSWPSGAAAISPTLPEGLEIGRRYRVGRLLGVGGMGAVYRVHDDELDRDVAMKLIRPDIAENPAAIERFKREIQLSSRVTHRNVLRVYDLGESDGIRFLTMQFVEGEDLSALLRREKTLPVRRLTALFRQILEGLRAAHEQGVIHRDLKPQNIMVDAADNLYVTDFGLAKSLEQAGVTQTGAVVGTPYYMSPEQVKGTPVDHRSDIYSAGVILYEMATGRLPFTGSTPYEVMAHRVQRPPTPAGELNPELPAYLRKILERCMAVDPSARYQSAAEVIRDLDAGSFHTTLRFEVLRRRWILPAALAAAAVALAAGMALWLDRRGTGPAPARKAVAPSLPNLGVVPFQNRTGDPSLDWYGEGIARLIGDGLAQSRHLQVVSPDRIEALLRKERDPASLARASADAGIGHLLTGDILPAASTLTLAVRLTETKTGRQVASRRIDGLTRATLLAAADEVAMAAKKGLGVPPTEKVDVFAADFATRNPKAYESYIAGLRALTDYRYPEAERAFTEALAAAPDFTMARYRLAHVQTSAGRTEEGLENMRRAVAESSRLPDREARYVRAADAYFSRRSEEAVRDYQDLLSRYPYEIEARSLLAQLLLETGKNREALEQATVLARLAPESHVAWSMLGSAHLALKNFNDAVLALRRYVELEPKSANAHHLLADSYRCQGELDLAAEEYRKALDADPSFHYATVALATVEVLAGRREEAGRRLQALVSDRSTLPLHRIDAAFALASLRRSEERFREATRILESVEKPIAAEKVREAMALSERGRSLAEIGDGAEAGRLIALAIERSPGVPTRYLFARGLLELAQKKASQVRQTADRIAQGALPRDNPDRTEEKAASYLRGMALLAEERAAEAREELSRSVALNGYEYGIYRLGLARAYAAAEQLPEAIAAARQAAAPQDPVEPRLDLELDRARALLLVARLQEEMGRKAEAAAGARALLAAWSRADAGLPDVAEARRLAAGGP